MTWLIITLGCLLLLFGFMVLFGAPYVPSQSRYLRRALTELYPVSPKDHVIDVGSGDGIVLRTVSSLGGRATGYEINPILWFVSRTMSHRDAKVNVVLTNFWRKKLPDDTTLVYAFAVQRDAKRLTRKLQYEADRLQHPLALLCLGNPLPAVTPEKEQEPYFLYRFYPSQQKPLTI